MALPRMRTVKEAMDTIKEADPHFYFFVSTYLTIVHIPHCQNTLYGG